MVGGKWRQLYLNSNKKKGKEGGREEGGRKEGNVDRFNSPKSCIKFLTGVLKAWFVNQM